MFPIHVINLDTSRDRLQVFAKRNLHLSDYARYSAQDGRQLDKNTLRANGYITETCQYGDGALGCALSHIHLWEKSVASGKPITILEDDAVAALAFNKLAPQAISSLRPDWDIVLWGMFLNPLFAWIDVGTTCAMLSGYGENRFSGENGLREFHAHATGTSTVKLLHAFGAFAYSISPRGAASALAHVLPLRDRLVEFELGNVRTPDAGIDVSLCDWYPTVNAYTCIPPLVIHEDGGSSERRRLDDGQGGELSQSAHT